MTDLQPRQQFLTAPGNGRWHQLAYVEWGDRANPDVVVCVHGLTRCGRDFDVLARALAPRYRVVCPDVIGRGLSDWLPNGADYGYARYLADIALLLARLDVPRVHWVGTSMGGILGMMLAAMQQTPLRSLVLNDVGSRIPLASLQGIASYVGKAPSFASFEEITAYLSRVNASFGRLDAAQWRELCTHTARQDSDGRWRVRYDPAIALALQDLDGDVDLGAFWQANPLPSLILRGAESGLLTADIVAAMQAVHPATRAVTFADCGHAPALQHPDQVAAIAGFLAGHDGA